MLLGLIYANGVGIKADDDRQPGISNAALRFPEPVIPSTGGNDVLKR